MSVPLRGSIAQPARPLPTLRRRPHERPTHGSGPTNGSLLHRRRELSSPSPCRLSGAFVYSRRWGSSASLRPGTSAVCASSTQGCSTPTSTLVTSVGGGPRNVRGQRPFPERLPSRSTSSPARWSAPWWASLRSSAFYFSLPLLYYQPRPELARAPLLLKIRTYSGSLGECDRPATRLPLEPQRIAIHVALPGGMAFYASVATLVQPGEAHAIVPTHNVVLAKIA